MASESRKRVRGGGSGDRLNPHLPPKINGALAYAYFMVGRYEDALRLVQRVPEDQRGKFTYIILSASLGALGRKEEAKAAPWRACSRCRRGSRLSAR